MLLIKFIRREEQELAEKALQDETGGVRPEKQASIKYIVVRNIGVRRRVYHLRFLKMEKT